MSNTEPSSAGNGPKPLVIGAIIAGIVILFIVYNSFFSPEARAERMLKNASESIRSNMELLKEFRK